MRALHKRLQGRKSDKENVFCKIPGEWTNQGMAYTSSISYTCMRFLPLGLEEVRMLIKNL